MKLVSDIVLELLGVLLENSRVRNSWEKKRRTLMLF